MHELAIPDVQHDVSPAGSLPPDLPLCWSVLLPHSMRLGSIGHPPLLNMLPFDSSSFADMEELAHPPASSAKTAHLPPLLQTLLAPLSRAPGRLIGSQFRVRLSKELRASQVCPLGPDHRALSTSLICITPFFLGGALLRVPSWCPDPLYSKMSVPYFLHSLHSIKHISEDVSR